MKKIALTGGIGSGKSVVAKCLEIMGCPVYYADTRAKQLMTSDCKVIEVVKIHIGENAYLANGGLNKPYIAQRLFSDHLLYENFEREFQKIIRFDFVEWGKRQNKDTVIFESAIVRQKEDFWDKILYVSAPENIRVDRVQKRDGLSAKEIEERVYKQLSHEEFKEISDIEIVNDNNSLVLQQILAIKDIFCLYYTKRY